MFTNDQLTGNIIGIQTVTREDIITYKVKTDDKYS